MPVGKYFLILVAFGDEVIMAALKKYFLLYFGSMYGYILKVYLVVSWKYLVLRVDFCNFGSRQINFCEEWDHNHKPDLELSFLLYY